MNYMIHNDGDIRDALSECEGISRKLASEIIEMLSEMDVKLLRGFLSIGNHEGVRRICGLKHLDA